MKVHFLYEGINYHRSPDDEGWEYDPENRKMKWKQYDENGEPFDKYRVLGKRYWTPYTRKDDPTYGIHKTKIETITRFTDIEHPFPGQIVYLKRYRGRPSVDAPQPGYYIFTDETKDIAGASTEVRSPNGTWKIKEVPLPKTGIMSYHLFEFPSFDLTKSMKHGYIQTGKKTHDDIIFDKQSIAELSSYLSKSVKDFIETFNGGFGKIDFVIYPESASKLDAMIAKRVGKMTGAEVLNDAVTKNIHGMYLDQDELRRSGEEYVRDTASKYKRAIPEARILNTIERGIIDANDNFTKEKQKGIAKEILKAIENSPSDYGDAVQELERKFKEIISSIYSQDKPSAFYNKGVRRSADDISDFQIKKLHQVARNALRDFFMFTSKNDKDGISTAERLKGHRIIVIDDNFSTGSSLDNVCELLLKSGVQRRDIFPMTLGIVPKAYAGGGIDIFDPGSKI